MFNTLLNSSDDHTYGAGLAYLYIVFPSLSTSLVLFGCRAGIIFRASSSCLTASESAFAPFAFDIVLIIDTMTFFSMCIPSSRCSNSRSCNDRIVTIRSHFLLLPQTFISVIPYSARAYSTMLLVSTKISIQFLHSECHFHIPSYWRTLPICFHYPPSDFYIPES
jgi:hypothetical protein